jgi:hypothetical protein
LAFAEVDAKFEQHNASVPIATWALPVVLQRSAKHPNAELLLPVVLYVRALEPTAEFPAPVVLQLRALLPTLVLDVILPPPIPTLTLLLTNKSPFAC